jgi:hypothetical protein
MQVTTSTSGSSRSLRRPRCVFERKLDVMARISPTIKVALLVLVTLFSFSSFGQNSTANAATQSQVGPRVQLDGELEIVNQDFKDKALVFYTLKLPNGTRVPLRFTKNPPTHFLTGDRIRVDGEVSGSSLVLYSGSNVSNSTSTTSGSSSSVGPLPNTLGAQSTLVILVNFQDNAVQPYTVADAQNMYFGKVNNFISENSYGQTSIAGDVVGWFTIPDSITTCNMTQIATDAQNAAIAAGANLSSYTRYVYAFPYNAACGWAGSSYVGGNPSQSWINGSSLDFHTIDHELGHAFGLWHSHLLDCGTAATIGSNCNVTEYGDLLDVMGISQKVPPHYSAFQKERLGWLNYANSPSIQTVQTSGTYSISPYELGGTGPNALKILKSTDSTTGAKTWYYIEARQALGFDSFLTDGSCTFCYTQNETTGVLFHIGTDGNGNSGDLLDMTPATSTSGFYYDPSLAVGQNFQDSTTGLTVTTTAVSSTGATVQIGMNGSSCTPANPSVSVSPSQSQGVASGTSVDFTATIVNNDSSACSSATFDLGNAVPSGWTGVWNTSVLSLLPGKSGSATLTVTSPAATPDGSYNVAVSATNASATSDTGSAKGTYVISAPVQLSISVTTNQSSYLPGQTVAVMIKVLSGTSPVAGASVTATVTPPGGRLTTLKGTTGSNGVVSLSYKLSRRATAGTYQVGATVNGASSVSGASSVALASTVFTVQ